MEFRWENAPIFLVCLLGIVAVGLLIHYYYIKRKLQSVSRDSQELLSLAAELEEAEHARGIATRLEEIKQDPIGNSVAWRSVRKTND